MKECDEKMKEYKKKHPEPEALRHKHKQGNSLTKAERKHVEMEQVFVKLEHQSKVSVCKMELNEKEADQPNFWKKSMELSSNYAFDQPDQKTINLPKLWGYQEKLPQISITWQDIKAAMPYLWAEQRQELSVDFAYNEFESFLPV